MKLFEVSTTQAERVRIANRLTELGIENGSNPFADYAQVLVTDETWAEGPQQVIDAIGEVTGVPSSQDKELADALNELFDSYSPVVVVRVGPLEVLTGSHEYDPDWGRE